MEQAGEDGQDRLPVIQQLTIRGRHDEPSFQPPYLTFGHTQLQVVRSPSAPPDSLDEERRTKIATALQQHRKTVFQYRFFLLRILADGAEAAPDGPRWPASLAEKRRFNMFGNRYMISSPESVKSPRGVLSDDVGADVISRNNLDGISHGPIDPELRVKYFAAIRARISKNVVVTEFPPADLEYLCTLVR